MAALSELCRRMPVRWIRMAALARWAGLSQTRGPLWYRRQVERISGRFAQAPSTNWTESGRGTAVYAVERERATHESVLFGRGSCHRSISGACRGHGKAAKDKTGVYPLRAVQK